jgi:hypothetical protein
MASIPSVIAGSLGAVTLGAGVLPAISGQLDKDGSVNKMIGGAAESIGENSTKILDKIGVNLGSNAKNAALLGAVAAAVLGGVALVTHKMGQNEQIAQNVPNVGGPDNGSERA